MLVHLRKNFKKILLFKYTCPCIYLNSPHNTVLNLIKGNFNQMRLATRNLLCNFSLNIEAKYFPVFS